MQRRVCESNPASPSSPSCALRARLQDISDNGDIQNRSGILQVSRKTSKAYTRLSHAKQTQPMSLKVWCASDEMERLPTSRLMLLQSHWLESNPSLDSLDL